MNPAVGLAGSGGSFEAVGWIGRIWSFIVRFGRRIVVSIVGFALIAVGLVLIPLPGPGWAVIFAGLAALSTEYTWAARLLHWAKGHGGTAVRLAVRRIKGLERIPFLRRFAETAEHELTDDETDEDADRDGDEDETQRQAQALADRQAG